MTGACNHKDCKEIATHWIYIELYPAMGSYEGAPAQLYFQDLTFCEVHAQELKYTDLIFPEHIAALFRSLGRVPPDFSKTQVKVSVIPGAEVV